MEVLLFFVVPWALSVLLLYDKGSLDLTWVSRLLEALRFSIVVLAWCVLAATFTWGVYVWFRGFYGYEVEGVWRVVFGLAIWPLLLPLVFQGVRISRRLLRGESDH